MWIHVTGMGLLQVLASPFLIVLNMACVMIWAWFSDGIPRSDRNAATWCIGKGAIALALAADALFVWWVQS